MHFWKAYNIGDCVKNLAWVWGDANKEYTIYGIWKGTLKQFIYHFHRFSKGEEIAKMNKAVVETANNFKLSVDEDDIEILLAEVPEELSEEELELEQEHIANIETREEETAGEEKEAPQVNSQ